MRAFIIGLSLFAATTAFAQQQTTPSEAALQITGIASAMAQAMTQQGKVIEDLQKQLAAANARIKELETKPAPGRP